MPDSSSQLTMRVLLDSCDPKAIFSDLTDLGVNADWLFLKGYQPSAAALKKKPIRARLSQALLKDPALLMAFLKWEKAPWRHQRNRLAALDEAWLLRHWREILRTPRGLMVAAAMAADIRESVARRGLKMLRKTYPWTPPAKPAVLPAAVADIFIPAPPAEPAALSSVKPLKRQLQQAKDSIQRLKKENRRLNTRVKTVKQQLEQTLKDHRREVKDFIKNRAEHVQEAEELAQKRVAAYRASLFGQASDVERRQQARQRMTVDQLVKKADEQIHQQAEKNIIFGSWKKLKTDRDTLLQLKKAVGEALSDAVTPLPELAAVHQELREKIDELNQMLATDDSADSAVSVENLKDCILRTNRGQEGAALLRETENILKSSLGEQLFSASQRQALQRTLDNRRHWLQLVERESILARTAPPPASSPGRAAPRQLFRVRDALKTAPSSPAVIIDGYNLIKNPAFPLFGGSADQPTARDYLEKAVAHLSGSFASVRIVYDGKSHVNSVENRRGIDVVFARLRGNDQQADDEIVDWLSQRPVTPAAWLVTNDNGLRSRATPFCEAFIAVEDFIDYVQGL